MSTPSAARRASLLRLRGLWLNVHLWLGVGLLAVLAPLGLSGSALVFDDAFDRLTSPGHYGVSGPPRLGPSAYLAGARRAFGGRASPAQVRYPEGDGPVVVSGPAAGARPAAGPPRSLSAWLDPATGRVLDVGDARATPAGVMHNLHGNLMVPGLGRKIVGWLGWAMSLSCLTGLWLWWPAGGNPAHGLRWRRTGSTLNNLHHATGVLVFAPLLVLSLTGVYIAFPRTSHALFGLPAAQGGGAGGGGGAPLAAPRLTADEAARLALEGHEGAWLASIRLPTRAAPAWRVQLAGQGPLSAVSVADATGTVKVTRRGAEDKVSPLMRAIHDGQAAPLPWRIAVFLTGLAPTLLGVTGTIVWLLRPRRRPAPAPSGAQAARVEA